MEFSFDCGTLLIHLLCLLLFINSHASLFSCFASADFLVERKEKEKENK